MDPRSLLDLILPRLRVIRGPDGNGDFTAWCIFHPDGHGKPPHEPDLHVGPKGYICFACKAKGGLRDLAQKLGIQTPTSSSRRHPGMVKIWYDYRDEQGQLLYQVGRKVPKDFIQRRPSGNCKWIYSLNGTRRVVYRLPELLASFGATAHVVEGEKDVDKLRGLGLVATTNSEGAGKWLPEYAEFLRERDAIVLPDNDAPGHAHAQKVAASLRGVAQSVKVVALPGLDAKGDISDWLDAGHTIEELKALADATPEWSPLAGTGSDLSAPGEPAKPRTKRSQADVLVDLAEEGGIKVARDSRGETICFLPVNGHREVWPCTDRHVKAWLTRRFAESEGKTPNLTALCTAINSLDAQARMGERVIDVHNRIAGGESEIWVDLSDQTWDAVRVTPDEWDIAADPLVAFRRYNHQRPQMRPISGGTVDELLDFVNVSDEQQRLLLKVYVVSCFIPGIPHPILVFHGPQGSAKTTITRILGMLIDPSLTPTMALPQEPDRLVQTLDHHWLAAFDNVSNMPRWASDVLCRAATGDGMCKRALYTNDDDFIYAFRRCVILNGINIAGVQPDFLDRALLIGLDAITAHARQTEAELWARFEECRPRIVGAILSILSKAMSLKPTVFTSNLPRMADFAHWGMAIAMAMGHSTQEFLSAYDTNVATQNEEAINAHPVSTTVLRFMDRRARWEGTPSDLLRELTAEAERQRLDVHGKLWPHHPNQLTRTLNELSANLAAVGLIVEPGPRSHQGRQIVLRRIEVQPSVSVRDDEFGHRHGDRHAATGSETMGCDDA